MQCPCGSSKSFTECCEPFIEARKHPATAEQLMRSRYTAFTQGAMEYIVETHDSKTRSQVDTEGNAAWAESSDWLGLEILDVIEGGPEDERGQVEFKCRYMLQGEEKTHHELSDFRKVKGRWYFVDGKNPGVTTFVREEKKVGRNDPCPCGSGKKFKKCCGG